MSDESVSGGKDDAGESVDRVFAERVLTLARKRFPLLDSELTSDLRLRLGKSHVSLFNLSRLVQAAPQKFESIVLPALATSVRVQEWGDAQTAPPLANVQSRIMPMLYPEGLGPEPFSAFVWEPWIAGLMVLYVVDEAESYWYIRDELRQQWGVSSDDLNRLALQNLDAHFADRSSELVAADDKNGLKMVMPQTPDAYNATLALSRSFQDALRKLIGPECLIGVANRDFFIAFHADSREMRGHICRQVGQDYGQKDHPLTDRLLLLSQDGISEWSEDAAEA